jgi:hypothetical protein
MYIALWKMALTLFVLHVINKTGAGPLLEDLDKDLDLRFGQQ